MKNVTVRGTMGSIGVNDSKTIQADKARYGDV